VVVGGPPAESLQLERRVQVLGDRLLGDSADGAQCGDAEDGGGSAPERSRAGTLPGGELHVEEQPLFAGVAVVVEGAVVEERLRTLHERHLLVLEVAESRREEALQRDVVTVENRHEVDRRGAGRLLPGHQGQGVVEVARLGVLVLGAGHVPDVERAAEVAKPGPVTVVEHPRLVHGLELAGRRDRRADDLRRFVVGRDQHGDPHAHRCRLDRGQGGSVDAPPGHQLEGRAEERQGLEGHQEVRGPAPGTRGGHRGENPP
jgi:hypothetical protein